MKKFLSSLGLISILSPVFVFAQNWDVPLANDDFAYASLFAGNFSLLLSVVIGVIAAFFVFRSAQKMGGGLFGIVLNYVGVGMVLIVCGTVASISEPWFDGFWINVVSTACFALGYIFMVIGANKLLKGIMTN